MMNDRLFQDIKWRHDNDIAHLNALYLNKEVTLVNTWPKVSRGRAAIITHIMINSGIPLFLCMVLRSGSETDFLNSEGWTRSYRPWSEFLVTEGTA